MAFVFGLVIGVFWRDLKWLTYDFAKAICKGAYNAIRVCCFGELMPGVSRWQPVKQLLKVIYYEARAYLKWEWLAGCKLTKSR